MRIDYIVQGHRFDIVEDFGCRPTVYVSIPAVFLIWVLPLIAVVLTYVFSGAFVSILLGPSTTYFLTGIALVRFFRRRISFALYLKDSNSPLTQSRYFRLMIMALFEMFWGIVVTACNMWFTCRYGMRPWTYWADVHSNFSRIALYPTLVIPSFDLTWTYYLWWTVPVSGYVFTAFFAFGEDAMQEYAACIAWIRSKVFRQSPQRSPSNSHSSFTMYVFCSFEFILF